MDQNPICTTCDNPVLDQPYFACRGATSLPFHPGCLSCQICEKSFELDAQIYTKNGQIFCHNHYLNQFGPQCLKCEEHFHNEDLCVKIGDKFIHQSCLKCTECHEILETGTLCNLDALLCAEHSVVEDKTSEKKRVPRTKFTQDQYDIMMRVFAQTPRPTRLMREQMAKQTGLEIRCIQIWFQNRRSKEKRVHNKRHEAYRPTNIMPPQTWYPIQPNYQPMLTPPSDNSEYYEPPTFEQAVYPACPITPPY